MKGCRLPHVVAAGLMLALANPVRARADKVDCAGDVSRLQNAGIGTEGPDLLGYLRKRSPVSCTGEEREHLLTQLGDKNFRRREEAQSRLARIGWIARDVLEKGRGAADREVARAAERCLEQIEKDFDWGLLAAAVREVARQKPARAVEAVLGFVPNAADDEVLEEVWYALDSLAGNSGRLDPALVRALADPVPARRAVAACIVGRRGSAEQRVAVRRLLADPEPMVRLRAAQGLLAGQDRAALATLVALLDEAEVQVSWQAEELLHWAAGDTAPDVVVGAGSAPVRRRCRIAWERWQREYGPGLDLTLLDRGARRPGLVLGVAGAGFSRARLILLGCDGRPRWHADLDLHEKHRESPRRPKGAARAPQVEIDDYGRIQEVHLLPGNRLLVAEDGALRVTERDLDGSIVWEYRTRLSVRACRRLPSGNILVVSTFDGAELSAEGKELRRREFQHDGRFQLEAVQCTNTGGIICLAIPLGGKPRNTECLLEYDLASGRRLREVPLARPFEPHPWVRMQQLAGGCCLLAEAQGSHLVDATGRSLGTSPPGYQYVLRSGNRLRAHHAMRVVEETPDGRLLWEGLGDMQTSFESAYDCLSLVRFGFAPRRPGLDLTRSDEYRLHQLRSKDRRLRLAALMLLSRPQILRMVPVLLDMLDDPDPNVAGRATAALADACPEALPPLLDATKDTRPRVRAGVLFAVAGQVGRVKQVAPVLLNALKNDSSPQVRASAASGIGRLAIALDRYGHIDPGMPESYKQSAAHQHEMAMLEGLSPVARRAAKQQILKVALPLLLQALEQDEPPGAAPVGMRESAYLALAEFGADAQDAIPRLLALTHSSEPGQRFRAIAALCRIAPKDERVFQAALRLVRDPEPLRIRSAAAELLGLSGPKAKGAVCDLISLLQAPSAPGSYDPAPFARGQAAKTLGAIGPAAKAAIPALTKTLHDEWEPNRSRAQEALQKIRGP